MSEIKVNKLSPRSGTAVTLGDSGDTFTIPSGATLAIQGTVSGFTSVGIDDNATSVAITIDSNENVGIGTTSPNNYSGYGNLTLGGTSGGIFDLEVNGTRTGSLLGLVAETRLASITNIPVTFQVNNAEKMRLNSTGLGIGNSNPTAKLQVTSASSGGTPHASADELAIENSANAGINILSGASNEGAIYFGDSSDNDIGRVRYNHSTNAMDFTVNASVRATIDSSGNFFVATTTEASDDVGHALLANGAAYHTADGTYVGLFNRKSSNGEVVQIRKDNTVVGKIGIETGGLTVDGEANHSGIMFSASSFLPRKNYSSADGTVDLGTTDGRWKDLYLGGGAFIGGTGAANKLEDYEEGTWTPGLTVANAGTSGTYTKIGNYVFARFKVNVNASGNDVNITGLPFTSTGATTGEQIGGSRETQTTGKFFFIRVSNNSTSAAIIRYDANVSFTSSQTFEGQAIYLTT